MKKISGKWVRGQILKRLLYPRHLFRFLSLLRGINRPHRSSNDEQLKLYSQILPGDFLHYGYFDDPLTPPESISLHDIQRAQVRYAELIIEQINDRISPVLDAGCGMGGLLNLLIQKGFASVGLTPDRFQMEHITQKYPDAVIIGEKFEDIPPTYKDHFGTIITSESLQYMNLDKAIANVANVMKSDGRWIVIDYFRSGDAFEKSGHHWETFKNKLDTNAFRIVFEKDITRNVFPGLSYVHMLGERLGVPLFEFITCKLEKKQPALFYLLEEIIGALRQSVSDNIEVVNPEVFTRDKKYMLLSIENNRKQD